VICAAPATANSLTAMRAATWAVRHDAGRVFANAAFQLAFCAGRDLTQRSAVLAAADRAGLDTAELDQALDDPELKGALRTHTDAAIAEGVYGVPTFDAAGLLWLGNHQLEAAAAYHQASSAPAGGGG